MRTKFLAASTLVLLTCLSASAANAYPIRAVVKVFELCRYGRSVLPTQSRLAFSLSRSERLHETIRAVDAERRLLPSEERELYARLTREDIDVISDSLRPFAKADPTHTTIDAIPAATNAASEIKKSAELKFTVLDGELKIGSLKKFSGIEIEGGRINVYKTAAAGTAAAYCGATACIKVAGQSLLNEVLKVKEITELAETIAKAKQQP
jgi:hypothetical protein